MTGAGGVAAPSRARLVPVLVLAVLAMSSAAPLIRLATAPALVIAFWRMVFSTALTGTLQIATAPPPVPLGRRGVALCVLGGAALAAHFGTWIASLSYTSVAASVVLVNTQPLFAAGLATWLLREPLRRRQWIGIAVAMLGALGILWDRGAGDDAWLGNLLALAGAASAAVYYVVGRSLRRRLPLLPYVTRVYAVAALLLGVAVWASAPLLGWPAADWGIFVALAAGPGLLGHTLMNWSLRWLPAPVANVVTLGEPIGAALLAALLPAIAETPGPATLLGGLVTLAGIAAALPRRGER